MKNMSQYLSSVLFLKEIEMRVQFLCPLEEFLF